MLREKHQYFPQSRPHPGETLGEKLIEMRMGPKEFAIRTGKPEKTIIAVIKGASSITPDMAVQFEHVTKIPANFWINHQRSYDEYVAREKRQKVIQDASAWANKFPIREMIQKKWVPHMNTIENKTSELLNFFGFSTHKAWEQYYLHQRLKVAFRISLAKTKDPYAISAWLRKGELDAADLSAKAYSESRFKQVLSKIKMISTTHSDDTFRTIQRLCLDAGVKVVHTPSIKKAPISGSTRWLNDTPFIQLTEVNIKKKTFWFKFFHEAGHVLQHGKKDIFLENLEYADKDIEKEREADEFAAKWIA